MFAVTMLPAGNGDCLWVEYGQPSAPHVVLVDGGTSPTYRRHLVPRLRQLEVSQINLLIVTHVDLDHIAGVNRLVAKISSDFTIDQVWFNAWRHLRPGSGDLMGPVDGEILSRQLDRRGWSWNTSFGWRDRAVRAPIRGRYAPRKLRGGLEITVLAPPLKKLSELSDVWERVVREAGLAPGQPGRRLTEKAKGKGVADLMGGDIIREWARDDPNDLDTTEANGSSIVTLLEYRDEGRVKRCLLSGDAHADLLERSIRRLSRQLGEARLRLDAFKLPHHASRKNITSDLIASIDCQDYLVSTNGVSHKHPHREAIARVVMHSKKPARLHFNYKTEFTEMWDNRQWKQRYSYETRYGDGALKLRI